MTDYPESACAIGDCEARAVCRGWCHKHYSRWRRWGDPLYVVPRPSTEERFWAKVDKDAPNGCWIWTGSLNALGYGFFFYKGQTRLAHRVVHELSKGTFPEGLVTDHLCRTPACVNPNHLEPVTNRENTIRGIGPHITRERWRAARERAVA